MSELSERIRRNLHGNMDGWVQRLLIEAADKLDGVVLNLGGPVSTRNGMERAMLQPIETAPKDGTPVLIWDGEFVVAKFERNHHPEHSWRGTYGDGDAAWNPTHWMPLPNPPRDYLPSARHRTVKP